MSDYSLFPVINAVLNGCSAALLVVGRILIGRKRVNAHRMAMLCAFGCSTLFLISYLTYHALLYIHTQSGSRHFTGQGWWRAVYFTILISHTMLAAAIVPLVLVTLSRGLRGQYALHRGIARWTFPVWLYVSITGVIIYVMLYQIFA